MTRRAWVLSVVLALCLVVYVVWFTGLFSAARPVELLVRQMPTRTGTDVTLGLAEAETISSVTVERLDDGVIAWQLEGDPASKPIKALRYGKKVKQMVEQVPAQPLQPGVAYRITVVASAGRTGELEFTVKGRRG